MHIETNLLCSVVIHQLSSVHGSCIAYDGSDMVYSIQAILLCCDEFGHLDEESKSIMEKNFCVPWICH